MKKQFVWVGGVVFLCLCAAAIWAFTHPSFAIPQLQDYVLRKTGRTLMAHGGAKLTLLPGLGIRLDDVTISNPAGMDGSFARAEHVEIPIAFSDLFRRKLKISEITLDTARFSFLTDSQGRANWITGAGAAGEAGKTDRTAKASDPLALNLDNASAFYLDERNGQAFSLNGATARVGIDENGEVILSGTAAINSQFASIDGHLKSLARVTEDGSPADLAIRAPALSLNFDGRLGTRTSLTLAGTLEASSPDLRTLAKWLGHGVSGNAGLKNFRLSGALDATGVDFKLAKAEVGLDGMVANGAVAMDFSKAVPHLEATLSTDLLSLDPYLAKTPPSAREAPAEWTTQALETTGLKGIDASVALSAFKVEWHGAAWGPVDLRGTLKDSVLDAGFQNGTLYGGKGNAKVTLDGSAAVPSLQVDFDGHDLAANTFFSEVLGIDWLQGTTALTTSLEATGHNQQEMMSSLKGSFNIDVGNGAIAGLDIMDRIALVGHAIVSGWGDDPKILTRFNAAGASFHVQDGVATTADVHFDSPLASIDGAGEVDMLRRAVDFKFDPKLSGAEGEAQALPVKVVVKGPWSSPKIYPDVAGILENPAAAYNSLRNMGLPEISDGDVKKIEKQGKKLIKKLFGN